MNLNAKNKNINKKEFINLLQSKTSLSLNQTSEGVQSIINFFEKNFEKDCSIEIRKFGKFNIKNGKVKFKSFIVY